MKHKTQRHCQLLIIENSKKYDHGYSTVMHHSFIHVSLQLGEAIATIHWAHSLGPTLCWALSTCHSFWIIATVHQFKEWYFILHLYFLFLALVDKIIHHSVFLVANFIFGFCIIGYAEFQSCLSTPFIGAYYSCNMGKSGLPDIYTQSLRAVALRLRVYISGKPREPMLQLLCDT